MAENHDASSTKSTAMRWTKAHDIVLLKEILLFEPFCHKKGSPNRGKCWEMIAASLNSQRTPEENLPFQVNQRAVRDRYNIMAANYIKRQQAEERASGISVEVTELDLCLEDIIQRFKEEDDSREKENKERKEKLTEDAAKATEMRKRSLETFAETRERNNEVDTTPKRRNTGNETMVYLSQRFESESQIRREELSIRRIEAENSRAALQQQSEMFQTFLQNQQQQQTLFITLLERLINK